MAKTKNQNLDYKIRLLAIERMLRKDQFINTTQIRASLDLNYDIQVERKTLYSDLMAIDKFIPLEVKSGNNGGYKIMTFE